MSLTSPPGTSATATPRSGILARLRGRSETLPAYTPSREVALAGLGGALAITALAALTQAAGYPLLLGSFGASCVLVFGYPESPFSQPRNVIGGHLLSSGIGLAALHAFGPHAWTVGLAAGLAIAVMLCTRTVHPPAGSNPVIVFLTQPDWTFLLTPTLTGALLLVVMAGIYLNLTRSQSYPRYWLGRTA